MEIAAYILIAIAAVWGILTLISLRIEEEYIQELVQAAERAASKKTTRQSHGSE